VRAKENLELDMELIRGGESLLKMITLIYGMEKTLKRFYPTLKSNTDAPEIKQYYQGRVAVGQIHSGSLFDLNKKVEPQDLEALGDGLKKRL
jgi:hypothetical protein